MRKLLIAILLFALPISALANSGVSASDAVSCKVGGCSGQLCAEDSGENAMPLMSTCEWTEKYGCYKKVGVCEKQADGKCGWTQSKELQDCMEKANKTNGLKVIKIQ